MAYTYDALNRLRSETVTGDPAGVDGRSDWDYDAVGNRTSQSSTLAGVANQSFAYDANDRLASHGYDANGNTIAADGAVYTWDYENMLSTKTGGAGEDISLVYNGDGQLVEKTVDGVTTQFLVDDLNPTGYSQIVEEIVNGTVTDIYTYGHDLISQDRLSHLGPSWHVSFYGYDGHGSVRFLTDALGQPTDTYTYDAWGRHLTTTGTSTNPYLYAGERWLESLGLSYNRARMLSTTHGRFWSMDEWEGDTQQPVTLNKYLYGNGGPVMGVDPSGEQTLTTALIVVSIAMLTSPAYLNAPEVGGPTYNTDAYGVEMLVNIVGGAVIGGGLSLAWKYAGQPLLNATVNYTIKRIGPLLKPKVINSQVAQGGLRKTVVESFEGGIFTRTITTAKQIVYRAEGGGSGNFGQFYGTLKPINRLDAEELYNVVKWGNPLERVVTYEIPKGTEVFVGKVAGGAGSQIFIANPKKAGVKWIQSEPLPSPPSTAPASFGPEGGF